MKMLFTFFLLIFLVFLSPTEVKALSINFDFSGNRQVADSISFEDDISVTATAQSFWFGTWYNSLVTQSESGLGVKSGLLDSGQIDGLGADERLILTFSEDVIINKAWFTMVGWNDEFSLSVNGVLLIEADIPGNGQFDFTDLYAENRTGKIFAFSVTDWNDDYKVMGVEIESEPVPLPGAVWLFASGLIGFAGIRRKKIMA